MSGSVGPGDAADITRIVIIDFNLFGTSAEVEIDRPGIHMRTFGI